MSGTKDSPIIAKLQGESFSKKDVINQSLNIETANIIGTAYKGPAFVPQKLIAFSQDNVQNTVSNIFGTREENRYKILTDVFESKSNSQAYRAADLWFLNGGQQCSFTRVLGIGNGVLDSTKGTYNQSGFIVSELEYEGPKYYDEALSELSYNAGGTYKASLNFLIRKLKNTSTFISGTRPDVIDFRSNYTEELGLTGENKFITDTIITPKGIFATLNKDFDNIEKDTVLSHDLSLKEMNDYVSGSNPTGFLGASIKQISQNPNKRNNRIYLNGFKGFDDNKKNVVELNQTGSFETINNIGYEENNSKNYFYEKLYNKGHCFYTSYDQTLCLEKSTGSNSNDDLILLSSKSPSSSETYINYNDFNDKFQTAKTPWITSQPINRNNIEDNRIDIHKENCVIDLFRFYSLDDGESGNRFRIKVHPKVCGNSSLKTYSKFDIHIFEYKAKNNIFNLLKSFSDLDLNPMSSSYIARVFGDQKTYYDLNTNKVVTEGKYPIINDFLRIEIHEDVENKIIPTNSMPSGFRAYPYIDFSPSSFVFYKNIPNTTINNSNFDTVLLNIKTMPLQYVKTYSREKEDLIGDLSTEISWGVLFNRVHEEKKDINVRETFSKRDGTKSTLLKTRIFQKKITNANLISPHFFYTKYFQSSLSDSAKNVLKEDDKTNPSELNSYFNIEKVIYPVDSNNNIVWEMSLYKRSGKKYADMYELPVGFEEIYRYVNVDELLNPNINKNYQTDSNHLSFDLFTAGGFDGVNIFDNDKRFLSNNSIAKNASGPTYNSYKKGIEIATKYSNCDGDILIVPGVRERIVSDQCIDICEDTRRFIYIADVAGTFLSGKMSTIKKDINGNDLLSTAVLSNQSINKNYYEPGNRISSPADAIINNPEYRREIENNFSLVKSKDILRDSRYYLPLYNEVIDITTRFVLDPSIFALCKFGQTSNLLNNIDDISIIPNFSVGEENINLEVCDDINLKESNSNFDLSLREILESGVNGIGNVIPEIDGGQSIRLLSANTTYENRESLFRQVSNVRIINMIKKALKIDLFTSSRYIPGGVLFNQNSRVNGFYDKVKLQIESVLRTFKDDGVIKDFLVRLPGRNDDRTIEDMNNYVLRGNIYIQFNKDDTQSLVELNLTDILSELSLLTSSIQDVIIPT